MHLDLHSRTTMSLGEGDVIFLAKETLYWNFTSLWEQKSENSQLYCFWFQPSLFERWSGAAKRKQARGVNQEVPLAARAITMITHINNRPSSGARQRTYKGRRQEARHWIRRQFGVKWIPSATQIYWSVTKSAFLVTWLQTTFKSSWCLLLKLNKILHISWTE